MASAPSKRQRLREAGTLNAHPERVLAPRFQHSPFYDPADLLQVRYELIRDVRQDARGRAQAARDFGLSRHTLHRLERLFEADGLVGLVPRQRGPLRALDPSRQPGSGPGAPREKKRLPGGRP